MSVTSAPWSSCLAQAGALIVLLLGIGVPQARAGVANSGIAGAPSANPLAGIPWGKYTGDQDEVFPAYRTASGNRRRLLGLIAMRPRARWFGPWYADDQAEQTVGDYIANVTHGNPRVLVQMAVFRLDPWEGEACRRLPTATEQASYRKWIDNFAAGIGSARVALILQPDLPFALCAPFHSKLPLQLVAYAARRFAALARTSVYIDVGAADWPTIGQAAGMLRSAGVGYARGFALNATHYDTTQNEVLFGQRVSRALGALHIRARHFVVNTAGNGRGFTYRQYHGPNFDNAAPCRTRRSRRCVTLGIPPTTDVAAPRWGLSSRARAVAAQLCDAYLWYGRPWLDNQSHPFDLQRALQIAASTPF
ncbi:MAG: glycoside hydrolase family 6 protein [Solirubrobacteraceae bacterium]